MDPEKHSDANPYHESPPSFGGRPNYSGLAALAGSIFAVSVVFFGFIAD